MAQIDQYKFCQVVGPFHVTKTSLLESSWRKPSIPWAPPVFWMRNCCRRCTVDVEGPPTEWKCCDCDTSFNSFVVTEIANTWKSSVHYRTSTVLELEKDDLTAKKVNFPNEAKEQLVQNKEVNLFWLSCPFYFSLLQRNLHWVYLDNIVYSL